MTTELATIDQIHTQLATLPRVAALVRENLGAGVGPLDLARIRIPAGGGLAWEYPTAAGPEPRSAFEGVILARQNARAFWATSLEAGSGNAPPDCRSDDGIYGVGDPGGDCSRCPFAQFGSKEGSNAQACKALVLLYVMVPGEMLPIVVVAPPTSLRPVKDYMLRLTSSGNAYWHVVTRFGLESSKNAGGIKYSQISLTMAGILDEPSQAALADARTQMAPLFGSVEVSSVDVGG